MQTLNKQVKKNLPYPELVMGYGSKSFDLGRVGSNFCCFGRVGSAVFGLGLENFPFKYQIRQFFALRVKKRSQQVGSKSTWVKVGLTPYLLRVKYMLGWSQAPSLH